MSFSVDVLPFLLFFSRCVMNTVLALPSPFLDGNTDVGGVWRLDDANLCTASCTLACQWLNVLLTEGPVLDSLICPHQPSGTHPPIPMTSACRLIWNENHSWAFFGQVSNVPISHAMRAFVQKSRVTVHTH
jgi:hypothetical protein